MGATAPTILKSQPGIKRDGTRFDGENYTDGQWIRFQRGLPRKIGGYRSVNRYLSEISRGFNSYTQMLTQYCHTGSASKVERFTLDAVGNSSTISNRTPGALVPSDDNRWMFVNAFDASTTNNQLLAHVAPNGQCICNDQGGQIFSGDLTATAALTAVALPAGANATGGIVMLHPYLFYYGNAGIIGWSVPGTPTDLDNITDGSGIARVWGQKIIKGLPLRAGGGTAPAGIFWAYDAVIRSSFVGGAAVFNFDVLATGTSIMSADSVIDYDGVFYWAGVDKFLMFNGVVRDVPNQLNTNYFFDGLNNTYRSKVFAFKVPRYGEIWWCYPRGDAIECSHAVIFNVREGSWYDTELPSQFRSAGGFNNGFAAPLLCDATPSPTGYRLWQHEYGVDEIDGQNINPVLAYFETADLSAVTQGKDIGIRVETVEPDFVQTGPMTLQVMGRANARAPEITGELKSFEDTAEEPYEQVVMLKEQRRELRFRFTSNAVGGDFQMGQLIGHLGDADGTKLS